MGGGKGEPGTHCWRMRTFTQLSGVPDIFRARPYYDDRCQGGRGDDALRVYYYVRVLCTCVIIIHAYRSPHGIMHYN